MGAPLDTYKYATEASPDFARGKCQEFGGESKRWMWGDWTARAHGGRVADAGSGVILDSGQAGGIG